MVTLENRKYFNCPIENRATCYETIDLVCSYAVLTRKKGLLELECRTEGLPAYQKKILHFIVDGLSAKDIRGFCEPEIVASGETGAELLKMVIFLEGMLSVMSGIHPRILRQQLESYIGQNAVEYYKNSLEELPDGNEVC